MTPTGRWQHEVLRGRSHCLVGNLGGPAESALWWQSEVLRGRSHRLVVNLDDSGRRWRLRHRAPGDPGRRRCAHKGCTLGCSLWVGGVLAMEP